MKRIIAIVLSVLLMSMFAVTSSAANTKLSAKYNGLTLELSWNGYKNVDFFRIMCSEDGKPFKRIASVKGKSYEKLLEIGVTYRFKVCPVRKEPDKVVVGEFSNTVKAKIPDYGNWAMFIVNKENLLPEDYKITLSKVQGDFMLDSRCAPYAIQMINDAAKDGVPLKIYSSYRSPEKQAKNFYEYMVRLKNEGHSEAQAIEITKKQIMFPYESEHNAGFAADILSPDWFIHNTDYIESFDETIQFEWLYKNCHKYGFILRYPKDKTDITNIDYEPWHFRYVGCDYAEDIMNSGLCLEEYFEKHGLF